MPRPGRKAVPIADQEAAKRPLDIDLVMDRIREAVRPFAKAAMFELAEEGYRSPFEQLVACMISIRTRDETMIRIARELFQGARTPAEMLELGTEKIAGIIRAATSAEAKAGQIVEIARRIVAEHGGEMPCDNEVLLSFRGVGPKCANLVLGIACDQKRIGVDVHVHRVTNR